MFAGQSFNVVYEYIYKSVQYLVTNTLLYSVVKLLVSLYLVCNNRDGKCADRL